MESFIQQRSRNMVIKRMIQLGLIADRSEILPSKRRKAKKSGLADDDSDGGSNSDDDDNSGGTDSDESGQNDTRRVKVTVKNLASKKKTKAKEKNKSLRPVSKISLNEGEVQRLLTGLDENLKEAIEWIQESLSDAADDFEEISEDADDGVPLVPFTAVQRDAFENETFKAILLALGIQQPAQEMVNPNSVFVLVINSITT